MSGLFVTFEGIDGCGKSTQLKKVAEAFPEAIVTREPGGTKISEKIRQILLDSENREMTNRCETLLYEASRAQLVEELIKPQLNQNKMVLCDRFYDSTIAYQVYGRSVCSLEEFSLVNEFAVGSTRPNLTLIFDLPVEVAFARMKDKKADRLESLGLDFFQKVREGFRHLASRFYHRAIIINANRSAEEVYRDVLREVVEALKEHGASTVI